MPDLSQLTPMAVDCKVVGFPVISCAVLASWRDLSAWSLESEIKEYIKFVNHFSVK